MHPFFKRPLYQGPPDPQRWQLAISYPMENGEIESFDAWQGWADGPVTPLDASKMVALNSRHF